MRRREDEGRNIAISCSDSRRLNGGMTLRPFVTRSEAPLDVLHFHYALPFAAIADRVARRLGPHAPAPTAEGLAGSVSGELFRGR